MMTGSPVSSHPESKSPGTAAATTLSNDREMEWHFLQCFGVRTPNEEIQDADIISAIDFDRTGNYLATGDKGGRVVLFEKVNTEDEQVLSSSTTSSAVTMDHHNGASGRRHHPRVPFEYRYYTEFQSHMPEFDYLKSLEIEEKINKVKWCHMYNSSKYLLSTNDKTIKLWRVRDRKVKQVSNFNLKNAPAWQGLSPRSRQTSLIGAFRDDHQMQSSNCNSSAETTSSSNVSITTTSNNSANNNMITLPSSSSFSNSHCCNLNSNTHVNINKMTTTNTNNKHLSLKLPRIVTTEKIMTSTCVKVYGNAHAYHINSISLNSDQETFLSADDLRIHLWNLDETDVCFNIVDLKPDSMEDLSEVITCAEFHPSACNLFAYSSSKGFIRLVDMRNRALCDHKDSALIFKSMDMTSGSTATTTAANVLSKDIADTQNFFSELTSTVSDIKFSQDGRFILSRDYLTLKIWDIRMNDRPLSIFNVDDHLSSNLYDLYECDRIFDRFSCSFSPNGDYVMTGTYNGNFRVFGRDDGSDLWVDISNETSKSCYDTIPAVRPLTTKPKPSITGFHDDDDDDTDFETSYFDDVEVEYDDEGDKQYFPNTNASSTNIDISNLDISDNIYQLAWHPCANIAAIGACNSLYLFYAV